MSPAGRLDIRPFACPLTWVKTRIALEGLRQGEVLEVLLGDGEPLENVPRSAALEGHAVLSLEPTAGGGWRLLLRKGQVQPAPSPSWEA